ncbi:MAG: HEAT repeat domain-containing protein [Planctomycetota bacterium]|jgi:HEAT repeat protein
MHIKVLGEMPPWDWPEDAGSTFLEVLSDRQADGADRLLAAELAGNACAVNDELAGALLGVLGSPDESEELRGRAAIALGPALEQADTYGFEDPKDVMITEAVFGRVTETLQAFFGDDGLPRDVRRRILEAAVRAPQDWHSEAIRAAYSSGDDSWKLTAVFCMRYVKGFDDEIVAALSDDADAVRREALLAAGAWGIKAAWPRVSAVLEADHPDTDLLLAAIDAAGGIGTEEARDLLERFVAHDDEDVALAASEALAMAGGDPLGLRDDEGLDEAPPFPPHLLS